MSGTESNALKLMRTEKGSRTTHARAPVHTPRSQRQKQQAGFVVPSAVAFRLVHGVVLMMSMMMMRDVVYSFRSSVLFAAILQYGAMLLPDACTEEKKRAQSVLSSSLCINMQCTVSRSRERCFLYIGGIIVTLRDRDRAGWKYRRAIESSP